MGRKSTFEDAAIYAAVGAEIATNGRLTLGELTKATGISTGSLYHRFDSREVLLAQTWLDAVHSFQIGFLEALRAQTPDAGEQAALVTPKFCRANFDAAVVLASCRKAQFVGPQTPDDLAGEIAKVNDEAAVELGRFAKRNRKPLLACRLAIVAYPLAAVRLYLPHRKVPKSIDAEIIKAYRGAMSPRAA